MSAATAFALASALHAGFQITVTTLVYPALATRSRAEWPVAHARHTRAITPVVGIVYGALVVTGVPLVVSGPGPADWVALTGAAVALALTATVAAPLHGRLDERDDPRVARLLTVDRWRCLAAVTGSLAAVVSLAVAG